MMFQNNSARENAPSRLCKWFADANGVSAVEFALLSPLFCVMLAGMVDVGGVLYTQFNLNAAVSAGANYALVNASSVNSSTGSSLANTIATVVMSSSAANWANSSVTINDGPTTAFTGAGSGSISQTSSGSAANADSCYCPTLGAPGLAWGSATSCGTTCPSGGLSGKFVSISANRTYVPFLPSFGMIQNKTISTRMIVQVQ